jgi:hypothetical protein
MSIAWKKTPAPPETQEFSADPVINQNIKLWLQLACNQKMFLHFSTD